MNEVTGCQAVGAVGLAVLTVPFLPGGGAVAAPARTSPLSRSRFAPLVGARFTVGSAKSGWTAVLTRVADARPMLVANDDARYTLSFRADAPGLGDGTYVFSRAGFTATSIFVVADPSRTFYVATVNRG